MQFEYDEEGRLIGCVQDAGNGTGSEETWNYTDGVLSSSSFTAKGIYRNDRESVYKSTLGDDGLVTVLNEDQTFIDIDEHSKEKDNVRLEFTYDEQGRASEVKYYMHKTNLDHTEYFTYDEEGNVTQIRYNGDSDDYLVFYFTYDMREQGDREPIKLDGFQAYFNLSELLGYLL